MQISPIERFFQSRRQSRDDLRPDAPPPGVATGPDAAAGRFRIAGPRRRPPV